MKLKTSTRLVGSTCCACLMCIISCASQQLHLKVYVCIQLYPWNQVYIPYCNYFNTRQKYQFYLSIDYFTPLCFTCLLCRFICCTLTYVPVHVSIYNYSIKAVNVVQLVIIDPRLAFVNYKMVIIKEKQLQTTCLFC